MCRSEFLSIISRAVRFYKKFRDIFTVQAICGQQNDAIWMRSKFFCVKYNTMPRECSNMRYYCKMCASLLFVHPFIYLKREFSLYWEYIIAEIRYLRWFTRMFISTYYITCVARNISKCHWHFNETRSPWLY